MILPTPLKILNVVGFLLFAVFAFFQYNDIDPEIYYKPSGLDATLWLLFYALIAVLFLVLIFRPVPRWLLIAATLACVFEMVRTGPGLWQNLFGEGSFTMTQTSMSADDPRVELTREFFGALIALAGVGVLWWELRRFAKAPRRPAEGE
ncbi:MAG: hypothetical protein HKN82_16615 [Akkermansiaceae bacterium]|nr:hypothetical protein [Akkermansiaceae bacterium]